MGFFFFFFLCNCLDIMILKEQLRCTDKGKQFEEKVGEKSWRWVRGVLKSTEMQRHGDMVYIFLKSNP